MLSCIVYLYKVSDPGPKGPLVIFFLEIVTNDL